MGSLEGKNALVTGAGRGIGEATARKLASHGANVLINDLDADVAEAVASSIPGAVAFPADLTDPEAADQVVNAALEALGGLDIVVNNAGYIWHSAIHNMSDEQWDAMIDIHASAQFRILRAYGRWLRENAGPDAPTRKVVNVSSTMGVHGGATQLAYSAGKAAVVGIMNWPRNGADLRHRQCRRLWCHRDSPHQSIRPRAQHFHGERPATQSGSQS